MRAEDHRGTMMFFNPVELGRSFREVSVDIIETRSQKVTSHWYHSNMDADFFIWLDEKRNIIKQQLTFCGQVAEWNLVEGLKTGYVLEDEGDSLSNKMNQSEVIKYDSRLQKTTLHQVIELLKNMDELEAVLKKRLLKNFVDGPQLSTMDAVDIVTEFGAHLIPPRDKWWQRLLTWFKKTL